MGLFPDKRFPSAADVTNCPLAEVLLAFSSGKLPVEEAVLVARHVSECKACDHALRANREESAFLQMQEAAKAIVGRGDWETDARSEDSQPGSGASALPGGDVAATEVMSRPLPRSIGRYPVQSELGCGGFGAVYSAHDPDLDRPVAIKVPKFAAGASDKAIQGFLAEARIAAKLKHAGIVAVYEVGLGDDGGCYIVMEYVAGRSLAAELRNGKPPAERAAQIVAQAAQAVHYAHKKGLVHRDLKPGNILLDAEGEVKIADFGLALREDQQRRHAGEHAGTLSYMSPEQIRGDVHRLDGRSDIWALGVILYELLAGRRPFAGTPDEVADEILHRTPKPLRQINDAIPAELEEICRRCLAKDADQRYLSAGDLAAALEQWNKPRSQRLEPRWRAFRWTAPAIAVIAIAVATWLTAMWSGYSLPRSLDQAMPGEPVDLMSWPPEEILPQSDGDRYWDRSPGQRSIRMDSANRSMLGLGTTTARSFRIQVQMSTAGEDGCAGIFVGLKPDSMRDGRIVWTGQVIRVNRMMEGGPPLLERELLLPTDGSHEGAEFTLTKLSSPIYRDSLERSLLEVTISNGQIVEVKLGNERFPELADAKKLSNWPIPSCDGRLGLMNMRGSTTFSGCTYESLRSNDK